MIDILSEAGRKSLARFVGPSVVLAFDFDGTLAPLVSDPRRAALPDETRRLLKEVAAAFPVVVVTGRARDDVLRRIDGTGIVHAIGNHGIEPRHATRRTATTVARWCAELESRLGRTHGIYIEDKVYSISIHFRRVCNKRKARAAIAAAAASLRDAHVISGKQVINVLPRGAPHKGVALLEELRHLGTSAAVYVGDDQTDEDVFATAEIRNLLSIRVGRNRKSRARFFLRRQSDIDALLRAILFKNNSQRRFRARTRARRPSN